MVREAHDALERSSGRSSRFACSCSPARARRSAPAPTSTTSPRGGPDEVLTAREFEVTTLLHEIPAVTVAAINGACAGAGMGWALACDLRVMAASAKLNTAFLDVAVAGDMAIPWSLPRIVGAARARDLSFFPRRIEADEAERIGLVARVFADDTFRDDAEVAPVDAAREVADRAPRAQAELPRRGAHDVRRLRRLRGGSASRDRRECRHGRGVPRLRREAEAGVPMIRLRQVALVAHDLDAVVADLAPGARAGGRVQRSGRGDVRAAQRRAARRHTVHRGRVAGRRGDRRRPSARALGRRRRLHGDQPHRRPDPVPRAGRGARDPDRVRGRRPRLPDLAAAPRRHRRIVPRDRLPARRRRSARSVDAGRTGLATTPCAPTSSTPSPRSSWRCPTRTTTSTRWREILGQPHFDNAEIRWSEGTGGLVAVELGDDATRSHRIGGVEFRF